MCVGVDCSTGGGAALFACVGGECVDSQCTPETPEFCPVGPSPFCENGSACDSEAPCSVGLCESGVCLQLPSESECGEGEFCSAISGCTPEERPADAPEDPPGICGDACSLETSPCFYAYVVCTNDTSDCTASSQRPAGSPCPNGGVCGDDGECIEGVRTTDAGVVSDTGVSDMDVVSDTGVSDAGVVSDTGVSDMDVVSDTGAPLDMGATPCAAGYLGTVETGCYDIDECMYNVCDPLTDCTNAPGSYTCSACPEGFVGTGATGCDDEDECATNNGGCDPNAVCTNTIGSYVCGPCRSGYADDGESGCYDVNECANGTATCAEFETCVNRPGSFDCEVDCANAAVVVETAADLAPFLDCEVLSSLRVLGSNLTTLSLPALRELQELYVLDNASLTSISLPVLGGWVSSEISNNASLVSISLPSLEGSGNFELTGLPALESLALDAITYIYSEISGAPQLETLHFPAAGAEHIQLGISDSGVRTIVVDSAASETDVWFLNNDAVESLEVIVPASSVVKGLNIQHNDSLVSLSVTRTAVFGNGEYTVESNPLLCDVELPSSAAARSWQVAVSGSCPTNICYGRAVLANASDVASVADCDALHSVEVTGSLTTLSLPNLVRTVTEEMYLRNQASLTTVSLPLWRGWSEDRAIFVASNLAALTSISIPSAESASISVGQCPSLRAIDVSGTTKQLSLGISGAPLLDTIVLGSPTEVDILSISGTSLTSLSFPTVTRLSGNGFYLQNMPLLHGFEMPQVTRAGEIVIQGCDVLEVVSMPLLAEASYVEFRGNPVLCSVPPPEQVDTPTYIYEDAICP